MERESEIGAGPAEVNERSLARKYGVRELVYPDAEQSRALERYLEQAINSRRSGAVPKTAVVVLSDFFQAVLNRQFLTKSPTMSMPDYELLQAPYLLAASIVTQVLYEHRELAANRGQIYQTTQIRLHDFLELLRRLLDPSNPWTRLGYIPDPTIEQMELLYDFVSRYPDARRRGRDERLRRR